MPRRHDASIKLPTIDNAVLPTRYGEVDVFWQPLDTSLGHSVVRSQPNWLMPILCRHLLRLLLCQIPDIPSDLKACQPFHIARAVLFRVHALVSVLGRIFRPILVHLGEGCFLLIETVFHGRAGRTAHGFHNGLYGCPAGRIDVDSRSVGSCREDMNSQYERRQSEEHGWCPFELDGVGRATHTTSF